MDGKYKVYLADPDGTTFTFTISRAETEDVDEGTFDTAAANIAGVFPNASVTEISLTSETSVWTASA